jgi:phosphoglycerate dehydrogenase-like enzyme
MSENTFDIVVLRRGTHGLPAAEYAQKLQDRLPDHAVQLAQTPHEERQLVRAADVVTSVNIDEALLEEAEHLRLFAGVAAGYDHLPLDALADRGVAVTNASGIHAPNIAEQVVGSLLAFTRRLFEGRERQQQREWRHYQAGELQGDTVTVVGLGSIGTAVVERLEGFGVHTIGVRYTPEKGGPADEVIGFDDEVFHETLSRTDHLVLSCPLTDTTRQLIDAAAFETLPPDAILVNVARGGVVDTDALVSAIRSNAIGAAALDVTDPEPLPEDHPLWGFENVLLTPHNAGHSPKHWDRLVEIVSNNVERIADVDRTTELENQVLAPKDGR